jgi:hypothetical protein
MLDLQFHHVIDVHEVAMGRVSHDSRRRMSSRELRWVVLLTLESMFYMVHSSNSTCWCSHCGSGKKPTNSWRELTTSDDHTHHNTTALLGWLIVDFLSKPEG